MRRYELIIRSPEGKVMTGADGKPIGPFASKEAKNGAGLQITFDLPVIACDLNVAGGSVVLRGVPVTMLHSCVNYYQARIELYAGWQKGLPLVNPEQYGMILNGEVINAWANWQGTDQSLNFSVNPSVVYGIGKEPVKIAVSGRKGERLDVVLMRALKAAFPAKKIITGIDTGLFLMEDLNAVEYKSMGELAWSLKRVDGWSAIEVSVQPDRIIVFDRTYQGSAKTVAGTELIGQPTWIDQNTVSFKVPLRHDLAVSDIVSLPRALTTGDTGALTLNSAKARNKKFWDTPLFSGNFQLIAVRHLGDFRNQSADGWCTVCEAVGLYNQG